MYNADLYDIGISCNATNKPSDTTPSFSSLYSLSFQVTLLHSLAFSVVKTDQLQL